MYVYMIVNVFKSINILINARTKITQDIIVLKYFKNININDGRSGNYCIHKIDTLIRKLFHFTDSFEPF
jgi:hypothetical protein